MVAELLGLKVRVLANSLRGPASAVVPRAIGFAAIVAVPLVVLGWLQSLRDRGDDAFLWGVLVVWLVLLPASLLVPILFSRRDPLHPRAFVVYGYRPTAVAVLLVLLGLLTLPALVLALLLGGTVVVWSTDGGATGAALAVAAGTFAVAHMLVLMGRAIGAAVTPTRWARPVRFAAAVLLVAIGVRLVPTFVGDSRYFFGRFAELGAWLETTPVAWLPLHPIRADGESDAVVLGACLAVAAALWLVWRIGVGRAMSPRAGRVRRRARASLGWFSLLPSTPSGAIAARSITYWLRDPRYLASFPLLPLVPILMLVATTIGGIPFELGVLLPLPAMVAVLAWATPHNDLAYDSTAVWGHIVADTRGVDDRWGRIVPPLVAGSLLVAIGAPLTALGAGDWELLPAILGVSLALLLGALGVSSGVSSRFAYPAPRPGDSAFTAPQLVSGRSARVQTATFLVVLVIAVPAVWAGARFLLEGGDWGWISLASGAGAGLVALVVGILAGGRSFDRRGPELLAFSVRN